MAGVGGVSALLLVALGLAVKAVEHAGNCTLPKIVSGMRSRYKNEQCKHARSKRIRHELLHLLVEGGEAYSSF